MGKFLKKTFISFLIAIVAFLSIATSIAKAQEPAPWYNQTFGQWHVKVFDPNNQNEIFGERYTYAQVNWIFNSLITVLIETAAGQGIGHCIDVQSTGNTADLQSCIEKLYNSLTQKSTTPSTSPSPSPKVDSSTTQPIGGLIYITNLLAQARPASGIAYISQAISKFHILPEAYAQGVGFTSLQPVQKLWGVTRNAAYFLSIIVFIAMAFMIMFRVKISPQATIGIQSALPRIVLALIFITFSYAIAGLMIDLSYVAVGLFTTTIKLSGDSISSLSSIDLFTQLISGNGLASAIVGLLLTMFLAGGLGLVSFATAATGILTPLGIVGIIIAVGLAILVIIITVRIFWLMIKTLLNIVLLIVMGPFMILLGTFPGAPGIGSWLRNLLANVAVYPVLIIMIFLSHYFFWGWFMSGSVGPAFDFFGIFDTFKIVKSASPPVFSTPGIYLSGNIAGFFLAFATLFLLPSVANLIQSLISGKPFALGTAIGEPIGPFIGFGRTIYGTAQKGASESLIGYLGGRLAEGGGLRGAGDYLQRTIAKSRVIKEDEKV